MTGILIDRTSGDILITHKQISIGENTAQCIEQILLSNRGEYKEFPLIGGEVTRLINGEHSRFWPNRVKDMCIAMGLNIKSVDFDKNGKIRIR